MRLLLIVNTVFEFAVSVSMIMLSFGMFGEISNLAIAMARVLAGNALGLGTLSWTLIYSRDRKAGLIALAVFHSAVAIAQIVNLVGGLVPLPVVIVHGVFAFLFIFFSFKSHE